MSPPCRLCRDRLKQTANGNIIYTFMYTSNSSTVAISSTSIAKATGLTHTVNNFSRSLPAIYCKSANCINIHGTIHRAVHVFTLHCYCKIYSIFSLLACNIFSCNKKNYFIVHLYCIFTVNYCFSYDWPGFTLTIFF